MTRSGVPTVVITGGQGLLGRAVQQAFADWQVVAPPRSELDVADSDAVAAVVAAARPRVVVHGAAFTRVDECEDDPEGAYRINTLGTANLARSAAACGARLIAVSTDYVFSGRAGRPYREGDAPGPISAYGWSKLAGEQAAALLCPDHVIARVSWLFGPGRVSFVDSLVRWGRDTGQDGPVKVADDQSSVPTSTAAAARAIRALAELPGRDRGGVTGVVHVACSGGCTRHELARAVFEELALPRPLARCSMNDFGSAAARPPDSRLDNQRLGQLLVAAGAPPMPHWRDALASYLRASYDA
ncbi:MAG: dTDP-4-dehydrorhamnose reductase [Myxococcota bacterium]